MTTIRSLTRDESLALLATSSVGRIGVTRDGVAHVVPVNYALLDGTIVFHSGAGTKLDAAAGSAPMSFEVDRIDEASATGWSVLVSGTARVVTDPDVLAAVEALALKTFDPSGKHAVVQLDLDLVSGREIA